MSVRGVMKPASSEPAARAEPSRTWRADGAALHGFRLLTIRRTDVRVHWTVPVFSALLLAYLASSGLPGAGDDPTRDHWLTASLIIGALACSLAVHELAHAVVARRLGATIDEVTIWLLGGVTTPRLHLNDAQTVTRTAIAGPAVSLVVGAATLAVGLANDGLRGAAFSWIGSINLLIGALNLVPAMPFDGAEIRAERLRRRGEDATSAALRTADHGMIFGLALIGFGVIEALTGIIANGIMNIVFGLVARDVARAELHRIDLVRLGDAPAERHHSRAPTAPWQED